MFSNVDDSSKRVNVCNCLHFGYNCCSDQLVSPIVGLEEHELLAEPSVNEPSSSESLFISRGRGLDINHNLKNITRRHNNQLPVSLNISGDFGK